MIDESKALELIAQGEGQHIEFKENVPSKVRELSEEVCAFANASGGYILIGVTDKNTFTPNFIINNAKRSAIQNSMDSIQPEIECEFYPLVVSGHSIWVIEVPEGDEKPYFSSGSVYMRKGSNSQKFRNPSDIRQLFAEAGALHYDEASCKWFRLSDISEQAVTAFKEKAGITSKASSIELIRNLKLLGSKDEVSNVVPMFFSDACGTSIPQAVIRCFRFKGNTKVHIIDSKTFGGPLLSQYNEATNWLKDKLSVEYIMDGFNSRKEKWEIPLDAIKEALTNSICHRDYYETGATITIELYDDRLEISNPGGLLPIVAKDFGHKSLSRNPKIFELFTRMNLVEKVGSGIPRMENEMKEANLPAPEYKTDGFFTTIFRKTDTFLHRPRKSEEKSEEKSEKKSEEKNGKKTVDKVLRLIKKNPQITTAELEARCKLGKTAIYNTIRKLKEEKIIEREGGAKGGKWKIL